MLEKAAWLLLLAAPTEAKPAHIDLILLNGRILTQDRALPEATATAVSGDRIVAVGKGAEIRRLAGDATERIDLKGAFVLPGLVDAHVHLRSLVEQLTSLDLRGLASTDEIVRRAARASTTRPPGEWLVGIGWDQNLWPERSYPDHRALSAAVPDQPVWLQRIDWYAGWANRKAMAAPGPIQHGSPSTRGA